MRAAGAVGIAGPVGIADCADTDYPLSAARPAEPADCDGSAYSVCSAGSVVSAAFVDPAFPA